MADLYHSFWQGNASRTLYIMSYVEIYILIYGPTQLFF